MVLGSSFPRYECYLPTLSLVEQITHFQTITATEIQLQLSNTRKQPTLVPKYSRSVSIYRRIGIPPTIWGPQCASRVSVENGNRKFCSGLPMSQNEVWESRSHLGHRLNVCLHSETILQRDSLVALSSVAAWGVK